MTIRDIEILKKAGYTNPGDMLMKGTVVYEVQDLIANFDLYFPEYSIDKVLGDPSLFEKVIYGGLIYYIHPVC